MQREYKTWYDWVGTVIHKELCKNFKFDQTHKWYIHNPGSVIENETHKLLWNFEIQTDQVILARQPDLVIINNNKKKRKENLPSSGLCHPGWSQSKTEKKQEER